MPQASPSKEYWRPANPKVAWLFEPLPGAESCWQCDTEYPPAARFCPRCGSAREEDPHSPGLTRDSELHASSRGHSWRAHLRLASAICLVLGVACGIIAALTGVIYRADTLVDWQAVQLWRIEWLLTAIAILLAGVLLKRSDR